MNVLAAAALAVIAFASAVAYILYVGKKLWERAD